MKRILACLSCLTFTAVAFANPNGEYPKIGNMWGLDAWSLTSASNLDFNVWGRYDLMVIAGWTVDDLKTIRQNTRAVNPHALLLRTETLTNAYERPPGTDDNWSLYRPNGEELRWWAGQIRIPNLLDDKVSKGLRTMAGRVSEPALQQGLIDGLFFDSVMGSISYFGDIDLNRDGKADDPVKLNRSWLAAQNRFFDSFSEWSPKPLIMGNDCDMGHSSHVNGRQVEGQVILDTVADGMLSAIDAVNGFSRWQGATRKPPVTFVVMCHPDGNQDWRIGKGRESLTPGVRELVRRDFRRMRVGLGVALLSGSYYAYDFGTTFYGLPLWYPDYDAPLGKPISASTQVPLAKTTEEAVLAWSPSHKLPGWTNPIAKADHGLKWSITQAKPADWTPLLSIPVAELGLTAGDSFRVDAEFEIASGPQPGLQWTCRSDKGGWLQDRGVMSPYQRSVWMRDSGLSPVWRFTAHGTLDQLSDYRFLLSMAGQGGVTLKRLKISRVAPVYLKREFAGGVVVVNPLPTPITVDLGSNYRELAIAEAPSVQLIQDDDKAVYEGEWKEQVTSIQYYARGYRRSSSAGDKASWNFVAPETGRYVLSASIPGGEGCAPDAVYTCGAQNITIDQCKGDGGWQKLFEVQATIGQRIGLVLTAGQTGSTIADAVQLESTTPLQQGRLLRKLTIGATDARILLRP
jgi:hypothetical protein